MTTDARLATVVDSNVLIDVLNAERARSGSSAWSVEALRAAGDSGPLAINPIIFAEVSIGFERIEDCEFALDELQIARLPLTSVAAFLAGRALLAYRRRGGSKRSPLPDFFIGAHAATQGLRLLTRDPARYRTHFPRLELIAPD